MNYKARQWNQCGRHINYDDMMHYVCVIHSMIISIIKLEFIRI